MQRYTDQNFKVLRPRQKIRIKVELEPKTQNITPSEVLFLPMTSIAIYRDIQVKKIK